MRTNERAREPSAVDATTTIHRLLCDIIIIIISSFCCCAACSSTKPIHRRRSSQLLSAYERRPFSFCHLDGTDVRAGQVLRSWAFKLIRPQLPPTIIMDTPAHDTTRSVRTHKTLGTLADLRYFASESSCIWLTVFYFGDQLGD